MNYLRENEGEKGIVEIRVLNAAEEAKDEFRCV